ncbi:MAG: dephospho-CoA kinase [Xylophilus ampelinus]
MASDAPLPDFRSPPLPAPPPGRPWRLGLTGGIGSGKSTVAAMLAARGAAVVDADAISRGTTAPGGPAIAAIGDAFGADFVAPDGALDRGRMRALAFADPDARRRLEAIVHPLVRAEIARQAEAATAAGARLLVFDVPLLVESLASWRGRLDRILVVDCGPETQVARVAARSGLEAAAVRAVIAAQATRAQRLAAADIVLPNDGCSLEQLRAGVDRIVDSFGL